MSASLLLVYICAAILVQVVLGVAVARSRPRRVADSSARVTAPIASAAWPGWREFRVLSRHFEDGAQTQCSFGLGPVDGRPLPPFLPGQFLTFSVPMSGARTVTRCYSLSDGPNAGSYRITVKRVLSPTERPELPPGACSNVFHDHIRVGDRLRVKAPAGRFTVEADSTLPIVLIAGGIGITPLLSMLRAGLAADTHRPVHLYYGVRNERELGFRTELEAIAATWPSFHLNIAYSRPRTEDVLGRAHHYSGHIDVDLLRRTLPAGRHRFYVCGPPAMMASLVPALVEWGVLPDDLHHEAFGPASRPVLETPRAKVPGASPSLDVVFRKSDRRVAWDGTDANLLEFAERHGLPVESGCRTGSCGTCEVELISGTVRYAEEPDHEVTHGRCLLCMGTPESDLEIEA